MSGRRKNPKYDKPAGSPGCSGTTVIDTTKVMLLPKTPKHKQLADLAEFYCLVKPERKARVSLAPVPCLKRPIP